jgi:hypothetical protein
MGQTAKANYVEVNVLCTILGNVMTIFMKIVQVFLA